MNTLTGRMPALTPLAAIAVTLAAIVTVIVTGDTLTAASIDVTSITEAGFRRP